MQRSCNNTNTWSTTTWWWPKNKPLDHFVWLVTFKKKTKKRHTYIIFDRMRTPTKSKYEGHSINKLQNGIILLIFRQWKFRNIHFAGEFNSEYELWVLLQWRMRVMNHNWSATKQRVHPQSVAEISRHSVLSGDRIWQCETSSGSRHKDTDQCL